MTTTKLKWTCVYQGNHRAVLELGLPHIFVVRRSGTLWDTQLDEAVLAFDARSLGQAKKRAQEKADELIARAQKHLSILD